MSRCHNKYRCVAIPCLHLVAMDVESTESPAITVAAAVEGMEDMSDTREKEQNDYTGPDDDTPALFVTSMPRDLWANPSLAGLAILIDEANREDSIGAQHSARTSAAEAHDATQADEEAAGELSASQHMAAIDGSGPIITPLHGHPRPQAIKISIRNNNGAMASENDQNNSAGGSSTGRTLAGRYSRHRDAIQEKRNQRRAVASPYSGSSSGGGSSQRGKGRGGKGREGRGRQEPTAGETQVLMSLWGI